MCTCVSLHNSWLFITTKLEIGFWLLKYFKYEYIFKYEYEYKSTRKHLEQAMYRNYTS